MNIQFTPVQVTVSKLWKYYGNSIPMNRLIVRNVMHIQNGIVPQGRRNRVTCMKMDGIREWQVR